MLPFLGREEERDAIVCAAQDAVAGDTERSVRVHIQGPQGIGKSQLIKQLVADLAKFDRLLPIFVNLSNARRDRFQHLMSVRRHLQSFDGFEADAFDYAAVMFDLEFRDGTLTARSLQTQEFAPRALLEEGVSDATKDGGKVAWDALGMGGSAGIGSIWTNTATHELLFKSLEGGAVALGTATSIIIVKMIVGSAGRRARKQKIFSRYPDLGRIAAGQTPESDEFEELLMRLMSDAIRDYQKRPDGRLPCIMVDPADALACGDADHPAVPVGKMVAKLISTSPAKLLLSTSRESLETWQQKVRAIDGRDGFDGGSALSGSEICLRGLALSDVQAWLNSEGVAPTSLPDDLLRDEGKTVWPLGLALWWGKAEPNPPQETEGETV